MQQHLFKNVAVIEECEVYHDEIKDDKNNPIAHGFLIVPIKSKSILLKDLDYWRNRHKTQALKINWKNLSGQNWAPIFGCARDWLNCCVEGMAKLRYLNRSNENIERPLGLRFFAIFMKSLNILSDDYWKWDINQEKAIKKFETLLRIGLKGGLHYLYSPEYQIKINNFVTDAGAFHRPIDSRRIINRLNFELKNYVDLSNVSTIQSCISDHRKIECIDKDSANLLQLCDLMLGSVSFNCYKSDHKLKLQISDNVRKLLDKQKRGRAFERSRHFKTFSISVADIFENNWKFDQLKTKNPILPIQHADLFK